MHEHSHLFPPVTPEMSSKRASLAPETTEAFRNFSKQVFAEGALDEKTKQLLTVAGSEEEEARSGIGVFAPTGQWRSSITKNPTYCYVYQPETCLRRC